MAREPPPRVATGFVEMLDKTRERQRNQTLTQKILGREGRRSASGGIHKRKSAPAQPQSPGLGERIAVRGTRKARVIAESVGTRYDSAQGHGYSRVPRTGPRASHSHPTPPPPRAPAAMRAASSGHVAGRRGTAVPAAAATQFHAGRQNAQATETAAAARTTARAAEDEAEATVGLEDLGASGGLSIRGLAGPFIVMGENFAEGTSSADVESAVSAIGGSVVSCRITRKSPVTAEIVLESREGAERVVRFFDGKAADSRILRFYARSGPLPAPDAEKTEKMTTTSFAQPQPKMAAAEVVDGSLGFSDPMDADGLNAAAAAAAAAAADENGYVDPDSGLFSDSMVPGRQPRDHWAHGSRPRGHRNGSGGFAGRRPYYYDYGRSGYN